MIKMTIKYKKFKIFNGILKSIANFKILQGVK